MYLENCGVDDNELYTLLMGLAKTNEFSRFIYKNNEFQKKSLLAIKPIMLKPYPHNLQVLRLVGCKTADKYVNELVEFLAYEEINLKSLGLIKMCLSTIGMEHICDYLERAYWLEDLDISFNNFRSENFRRFMQILSKNRSLKTLNLSMNPILPFSECRDEGDYGVMTKEERL